MNAETRDRFIAGQMIDAAETLSLAEEDAQLQQDAVRLSERAQAALTSRMPGPADNMDRESMRLLLNAMCRRAHRAGESRRLLVEELGRECGL